MLISLDMDQGSLKYSCEFTRRVYACAQITGYVISLLVSFTIHRLYLLM